MLSGLLAWQSWLEFEEEEEVEDSDMSEFETCVDLNMCQVMLTAQTKQSQRTLTRIN